jgi:hypothetical protein
MRLHQSFFHEHNLVFTFQYLLSNVHQELLLLCLNYFICFSVNTRDDDDDDDDDNNNHNYNPYGMDLRFYSLAVFMFPAVKCFRTC